MTFHIIQSFDLLFFNNLKFFLRRFSRSSSEFLFISFFPANLILFFCCKLFENDFNLFLSWK